MYMLKYIKLNSGNLRKIYELKHIKKILFAYVLIIYENIKHISRINVDFREKRLPSARSAEGEFVS